MKSCIYEMNTNDGDVLKLSLSMARQYRAKEKYNKEYAACSKILVSGIDDYMQIADVLYFAYVCAAMDNPDDKVMDYESFLDIIPDDIAYINNIYMRITGRKKAGASGKDSKKGQEK